MSAPNKPLTKAETVALWHAVNWMDICLRQGKPDEPGMQGELANLKLAKAALRKVNKLRKAGL